MFFVKRRFLNKYRRGRTRERMLEPIRVSIFVNPDRARTNPLAMNSVDLDYSIIGVIAISVPSSAKADC